MFKLFKILSKLMLVLCGMCIGAWIKCGYTPELLIGVIGFIILHYVYLCIAGRYIKSKRSIHIHELHLGDDKPDSMPDEIWEKVQELLSVTECPDKFEPVEPVDTGESDEP